VRGRTRQRRTGFRLILDREPDIEAIGEADDGDEGVELASRLAPDMVLMDVRMPRLNGIEAIRRLMEEERRPRVLILTTFDLDEYVYEGLWAGAGGFLLKYRARRSADRGGARRRERRGAPGASMTR
jgi:DNA-binding NarL/FixJ family response regulator